MTREEIIKLRDECDEWAENHLQCTGEYHPDFHTVSDERFAALVASAERKALRDEMWDKAMKLVHEATLLEREECAKWYDTIGHTLMRHEVPDAIRARGETK